MKSQGASDTLVIETKGNWIKLYSPHDKTTMEGNMDGSNLKLTGPDITPGFTSSIQSEGPNKLHYVTKFNDKLMWEGTQTLSADGKSFVEEDWEAGKVNEKSTSVFERQ